MTPNTTARFEKLNASFADLNRELTFRSYAWHRKQSPEIAPERWAAIFNGVAEMEARLQSEGNPHDCACGADAEYQCARCCRGLCKLHRREVSDAILCAECEKERMAA